MDLIELDWIGLNFSSGRPVEDMFSGVSLYLTHLVVRDMLLSISNPRHIKSLKKALLVLKIN